MEIKRNTIRIRDLVTGYVDLGNDGVEGWGGKLDIRPPYQREFIYDHNRQKAVINSVNSKFPLGIMYWVDREDGTYEVLDGQQRILSICKFATSDYSIDLNGKPLYYHNLTSDEQNEFLEYELDVYLCSGTEREKLDWFERINVVGVALSKQELRNASYTGPWLASAKSYFSKDGAPASEFSEYLSGSRNRQDWLETVIKWISTEEYGTENIERYMGEHKLDDDAKDMWQYFFRVMNWVSAIFTTYRKEMKGVEWGLLYNDHKEQYHTLNADEVEEQVAILMMDDEVKNKKGIYTYIFDPNEKYLNLRTFTEQQKRQAYELQKGICAECGKHFDINEMEGDHITPWREGGKTELSNLQMLCKECNRRKGVL